MYTSLIFCTLLTQAPLPVDLGQHVSNLSHRSYKVREAAQQLLYRLGWRRIRDLEKALEDAADPEARKRLEIICAGLRADRIRWVQQTVETRYGPNYPMIDALWMCPARASLYIDPNETGLLNRWRWVQYQRFYPYLRVACDSALPGDYRRYGCFRDATRAMLIEYLYEDKLTVGQADLLVMWMWLMDNNWWIRTSKTTPDPFWFPGLVPQKNFPRYTPYMVPVH